MLEKQRGFGAVSLAENLVALGRVGNGFFVRVAQVRELVHGGVQARLVVQRLQRRGQKALDVARRDGAAVAVAHAEEVARARAVRVHDVVACVREDQVRGALGQELQQRPRFERGRLVLACFASGSFFRVSANLACRRAFRHALGLYHDLGLWGFAIFAVVAVRIGGFQTLVQRLELLQLGSERVLEVGLVPLVVVARQLRQSPFGLRLLSLQKTHVAAAHWLILFFSLRAVGVHVGTGSPTWAAARRVSGSCIECRGENDVRQVGAPRDPVTTQFVFRGEKHEGFACAPAFPRSSGPMARSSSARFLFCCVFVVLCVVLERCFSVGRLPELGFCGHRRRHLPGGLHDAGVCSTLNFAEYDATIRFGSSACRTTHNTDTTEEEPADDERHRAGSSSCCVSLLCCVLFRVGALFSEGRLPESGICGHRRRHLFSAKKFNEMVEQEGLHGLAGVPAPLSH